MSKLLLATIIVMALVEPSQAQTPDPQWVTRLAGQYEGELASNGKYLPVSTFLKVGQANSLTGYYVFIEPGNKRVSGELTECAPRPPFELACQWHDPYGSGRVVFTFAKDLRSFKGRWSDPAQQAWFPWNGIRKD